MTTQVRVGDQTWAPRGLWQAVPTGWLLDRESQLLEP